MAADGKKKIDPFAHVVDSSHIEFFGGMELHGLEYHGGIPLKFILFITAAAIVVGGSMIWIGQKMKDGDPPLGKLWNLIESLLFFVRDKIAIPGIGEHDARKYIPYLTSLFLFIFVMNLMGMVPFMGSPTASIMVTGAAGAREFRRGSRLRHHGDGHGQVPRRRSSRTFTWRAGRRCRCSALC